MRRLIDPTLEDAARLQRIQTTAFQITDSAWTPESYVAFANADGGILIADDAISSGFVAVQVAADEAEIINLAVVPQQRRRGLARALLNAGETCAIDAGASRMFLEVAVDNHAALALYRTSGFSQVGQRTQYYLRPGRTRVDALVLSKSLGQ